MVATTGARKEIMSSSVSQAESELSEEERAGLDLIRETKGIHQSDFWKELGVSSRQGSRIVTTLIDEDLIDRFETVYKGNRTYFLRPISKDLNFALLMAGDMLSPMIGEDSINETSDAFSQWVMNLAFQEYQG